MPIPRNKTIKLLNKNYTFYYIIQDFIDIATNCPNENPKKYFLSNSGFITFPEGCTIQAGNIEFQILQTKEFKKSFEIHFSQAWNSSLEQYEKKNFSQNFISLNKIELINNNKKIDDIILKRFGMENCKPTCTPGDTNTKL